VSGGFVERRHGHAPDAALQMGRDRHPLAPVRTAAWTVLGPGPCCHDDCFMSACALYHNMVMGRCACSSNVIHMALVGWVPNRVVHALYCG